MKRQKTLHRFAALVAVLLTLCLVFMMPVGATGDLPNAIGAAAKVGEHYYSTLEYAVNNITASGTIVVQNNVELTAGLIIPAGKTIVLDLNGKTISMKDSSSKACYMIKNEGDLTIRDNSLEKTGKLSFESTTPDNSYGYSTSTVGNAGKLTVESGTIENNTDGGASYAIDNFWYTRDVETNINGGTITSKKNAIRQVPFSTTYKNTLTITGGEITTSGSYSGAVQTHCYSGACLADVIITGGTLTGLYAYYTSYTEADDHSATSIKISGGTFNGYLFIYNGNKGSSEDEFDVTITNGTFKGEIYVYTTDDNGEDEYTSHFISGGKYIEKVDTYGYTKSGYHCVKNADNLYEVTPAVTVTATPTEGGTVSFSYETTEEGTEITLEAVESEGYKFDKWNVISGEVIIDDNKFIMPDSPVSIEAVFEEEKEEPVTPPTEDTSESIEPDFDDIVSSEEISGNEVKVTIPDTGNANVEPVGDDEKKFIVTDAESGVSMTITFKEVPTSNNNQLSGIVDSVSVNYVNETETNDGSGVTDVKFGLIIYLPSPDISLPIINPAFNPEISQQIIDGNEGHTPLAMITASEVSDVNAVMKRLHLTFWIKKDEVGDMTGKEFVGYHITNDGVSVITLSEDDIKEVERTDGTYIEITLKGDSFSTWAVGIASVSEDNDSGTEDDSGSVSPGSSGGATDTGSGNYQYYPRDVPSSGIISFGTSKVVTGMELPAGSDGTVTLNIKPTFAMPENGFYAFEIDAPGYNLDAKINGGLSFQIPVTDLEAAGFTAEDIVLFHGTVGEDGKITWEQLPTYLNKVENGIAYYKAAINGCSPFYIGFVKDGSIINTEVVDPVTPETPVTPNEPEVLPPADEPQDEPETPASPAPILAVLAGLGAVAALRRK